MGVQRRKVSVDDLRIGMFVADLDRPWHETPFPIQGFFLRNQNELDQVGRYCRCVYVDVEEVRQNHVIDRMPLNDSGADGDVLKLPAIHIRNPRQYQSREPLRGEVQAAERMLDDISQAMEYVTAKVQQGRMPSLKPVENVARRMTSSIIRNPDALLWLTRVQHRDDYTWQHSLNTAIWALVLGRHLGLEPDVMEHLAQGALLCNVGKVRLPDELLKAHESELTREQWLRYAKYVAYGTRMMEQAKMPRAVINIVKCHRERHNGTGFPDKVTGQDIPLLAKIVGLVDYYEGLITPRQGGRPMSPSDAVSRLFELRNTAFQEDLVERFIQAVGIYPTGTLVRLSNDQVGVILSHRPDRRLWPSVMIVADAQHNPVQAGRVIDLAEHNEGCAASDRLKIRGCLPFGTDGIDPANNDLPMPDMGQGFSLKRLFNRMAG